MLRLIADPAKVLAGSSRNTTQVFLKIIKLPNGKEKVRIVNPRPGGAKFTSPERAGFLLDRGIVGRTDAGELFVYEDGRNERAARDVADYFIRTRRSNVIFWNGGTAPTGRHIPGTVRS